MKLAWIAAAIAVVAACGGKISTTADGGTTTDGGTTPTADGGCDPFAAARDCMRAAGVCGGDGSNTTCARGYKASPDHTCTSSCGGRTVVCCVADFAPHDASVPDATVGCAPVDVSTFMPPPYHPALHQRGACTSGQIQSFYADCLSPTATQQSCAPWQTMNRACLACLVTPSTQASWGPLVERTNGIELNVAGCMELAGGTSGASCAHAYQAWEDCDAAACGASCPVTDDASYQLYLACVNEASMGGCQRYAAAASCANGVADGGAAACFQGQTFEDYYLSLAPIFCGP